MQPVTFAAKDQRQCSGVVELRVGHLARALDSDNPYIVILQILDVEARLVTRATGKCSTAPADVLATASVMCAARRSGTMTALAPPHSAVLMTAPRLCGSSTPSSRMKIVFDEMLLNKSSASE